MSTMTPSIAIESVLGLDFGDIMTIKFNSEQEMNAFRLRLFRARQKMEKTLPDMAACICVKSDKKGKALVLSLKSGVVSAVVQKVSGVKVDLLSEEEGVEGDGNN